MLCLLDNSYIYINIKDLSTHQQYIMWLHIDVVISSIVWQFLRLIISALCFIYIITLIGELWLCTVHRHFWCCSNVRIESKFIFTTVRWNEFHFLYKSRATKYKSKHHFLSVYQVSSFWQYFSPILYIQISRQIYSKYGDGIKFFSSRCNSRSLKFNNKIKGTRPSGQILFDWKYKIFTFV